jgi:hypothetical protein
MVASIRTLDFLNFIILGILPLQFFREALRRFGFLLFELHPKWKRLLTEFLRLIARYLPTEDVSTPNSSLIRLTGFTCTSAREDNSAKVLVLPHSLMYHQRL